MKITNREKKNSNQAPPLGPCWQVCLAKQHRHHLEPGIACTASGRARSMQQSHTAAFAWQPTRSSFNRLPLFWVHKSPLTLAIPAWITHMQCPSVPSGSHYWAVTRPSPSLIAKKNSYLYRRKVSVHKDSDLYQQSLLLLKDTVKLVLNVTCIFKFWWFGKESRVCYYLLKKGP